jgi:tRNA-dihydrouridine synthase
MIGRGAIRNPWIFQQVRAHLAGRDVVPPAGHEVLDYVHTLYERVTSPEVPEKLRVQKMKKYLNFLGLGVEPTGSFLHAMRRAVSRADLFAICASHLDHDRPMSLEPFALELKEVDVMAGAHS